jgi:hypothetical protein
VVVWYCNSHRHLPPGRRKFAALISSPRA